MWAKILAGVVAATAAGGVVVHFTAPKHEVGPQMPRGALVIRLPDVGPGGIDRRGQPVELAYQAMGPHVVGLAACVGPTALPVLAHARVTAAAVSPAAPGRPGE